MKNNLLTKLIIFLLLNILVSENHLKAKEINLKASEILTFEEGNKIVGKKDAEAKIKDEIEIFADEFIYDKTKELLTANGNVRVFDLKNNLTINSENIHYFKKDKKIISYLDTYFEIEEKYKINSKDVNFDINEGIIYSNKQTKIEDNIKNIINVSSFKYFDKNKILNGNDIELIDNKQNKYYLIKGKLKLDTYELLGKDVKILLRSDTFGTRENEPKLKGNALFYKNDKTTIKKGIFTSCKENNNCPPWSITSKEIIHYKDKKEVHYKNAWLKLYNMPVFYFPKFFHPDPTVERKSGFLIPSFGDSKNLGASANIPYFHVISDSADLTFKPRFFSENEYLLQSEFRKEMKNSSHIADFSLNKTNNNSDNGTKTHFFSNSIFNLETDFFDESNIDLKIEKVSNDNYTQLYSLESTSPIIKDTSILENLIKFSGSRDDFDLDISFESYETMNKPNSDKYEFVYPNYSLTKTNYLENKYFDKIDFTSSGNQKKFSTNIYEGVQINDLVLTTNNFINKLGFNNNFKAFFKNVNTDAKNSSKLKDQSQSEMLTMISYDSNWPLIKENIEKKNLLTPKLSLRYSPNDTKNLKDETRLLTSDNIFSSNRIGFGETIESGGSLTLGVDYEQKSKTSDETFFQSKIATIFRDEKNENLPISSTIGKKQSDYVGEIFFKPSQNFELNYDYALNNDFDEFNFHKIENIFTINNFVNSFTFYEENNLVGKKSYLENNFKYKFDENNSLSFATRENKTDNLTEYYNLVYEYKNDCLTASIKYNKEYYSNSNLEPNEELFFNITLIPLGSTQTESILD